MTAKIKFLTLTAFLFISFLSYSQNTVELNMTAKQYKKVLKKLDLNITNRGYTGAGKIWVSGGGSIPKSLWNDALFEMDMPMGEVTGKNKSGGNIVNAKWIFEIQNGKYAFKVLDWGNNKKVVASINTKEGMWIGATTGGRAEEYKMYVKVMLNELLKTK